MVVVLCVAFCFIHVTILAPMKLRTTAVQTHHVVTNDESSSASAIPEHMVVNEKGENNVANSFSFNGAVADTTRETETYSRLERAATDHKNTIVKAVTSDKTNFDTNSGNSSIMAFIRIPKTGSTSLLNFLMSSLHNFNSILSDQYWKSSSDRRQGIYTCMFFNPHALNISHRPTRLTQKIQCAHANHGELHSAFGESMRGFVNTATTLPPLKTFTVVREPFDRLMSFFYYMRLSVNGAQWAKSSFTEAQYAQVRSGDFPMWLELLWRQKSPFDMQYEYLDRNATTAIEMMENETVHVYLNACFDTSLRLMARQYHIGSIVEMFLRNSTVVQSNNNKAQYLNLFTKEQLKKLREKAKKWFEDEYRFYNAAVQQFQRQLASSLIPYECPVEI